MRNTVTDAAGVPISSPVEATPAPRRWDPRRLPRHLGEMALAMVVGMLLLGPVWAAAGAPLGLTALLARPDVAALVMATNMTAGMTVWMLHRGHRWRAVGEMAAAMYLPFLLLLVPYRAGLVSADALLAGGHLLMVPAMVLVAVRRRADRPIPVGRRHPVVSTVVRRWPTWLALLMTFDHWTDPVVPSPWFLLVLPTAYLIIGAARRRLGERRDLALQLAGFAGWTALALVAVTVDEGPARWLVAAGWLAHAVWDVAHHRAGRVVPRGYAEWCAVLDTVIGITVILSG